MSSSTASIERLTAASISFGPLVWLPQAAVRLMRAGGVVTLLVLGTAMALFWRRERRRSRSEEAES